MDELKRLDDIEWREEVRKEAKKWLDSMKNHHTEEKMKTWYQFHKSNDFIGSMNSIEAWIKHFFDLE